MDRGFGGRGGGAGCCVDWATLAVGVNALLQFAAWKAFEEQVAGRVHPSASNDSRTFRLHRSFIAAHLAMGVIPFATLPALLAFGGGHSALTLALFAWLTAPILIALHLSRSGDIERSGLFSTLAFAGLVAIVACGDASPFSYSLPWLALPAVDAGLAGRRRGAIRAIAVAAVTAAVLIGLRVAGVPVAGGPAVGAVGSLVATVYALSLALRGLALAEAGARESRSGRAMSELFSGAMRDLVARVRPDGSAAFASPAASAMLGVAPRDLLGHGLVSRVHIADRPAFLQAVGAAIHGGEPASVEIRLRSDVLDPAGAPRFLWTELQARRMRGGERAEDVDAEECVVVLRDVAIRKAHEEDLIAAREEAERSNLAKTRFLANMSHELRTPLNAIIGFSEILSDESLCRLTPERRADYAALIHKSGAHLLEVVNTILDMTKIESGSFSILPEPCAIEPIVRHCASLISLKAETAGVRLQVDVPADAPEIQADRRAVTQILINLLANAVKFTPRGGEVAVGVQTVGAGLVLTVRDTGLGMAPADVRRVGEAFFQVDSSYGRPQEGSGLGLSVVRGLVDMHHGEMTVESALGCGTRVTVFLPLDCREAQDALTVDRVATPDFGRTDAIKAAEVRQRA